MKLQLKRENDKLYKRKGFAIKQGKYAVGFILPGEEKSFEIDENKAVYVRIDAFTGGRLSPEDLKLTSKWEIIPNSNLAVTPMIWSVLFILTVLLPLVSSTYDSLVPYLLIALLLTYLPLITLLKYKWLKIKRRA